MYPTTRRATPRPSQRSGLRPRPSLGRLAPSPTLAARLQAMGAPRLLPPVYVSPFAPPVLEASAPSPAEPPASSSPPAPSAPASPPSAPPAPLAMAPLWTALLALLGSAVALCRAEAARDQGTAGAGVVLALLEQLTTALARFASGEAEQLPELVTAGAGGASEASAEDESDDQADENEAADYIDEEGDLRDARALHLANALDALDAGNPEGARRAMLLLGRRMLDVRADASDEDARAMIADWQRGYLEACDLVGTRAELLEIADRIDAGPGGDRRTLLALATVAHWLRQACGMIEQADAIDSKWWLVGDGPNMGAKRPTLWLALIPKGPATPEDKAEAEAASRKQTIDGKHFAATLLGALDNLGELRARLHSADSDLRALRRQVRQAPPPPHDEIREQLDLAIDTLGEALEQCWYAEGDATTLGAELTSTDVNDPMHRHAIALGRLANG
jgi:hypothetical protein